MGGGDNYASLQVEDEGLEGALALWHCRWLGRILAWRVPCGTIYIGPHWYFSVVMLGFILGVGVFHISSVKRTDRWQLLGGYLVTILSTLTFVRCALASPGVLRGPRAPAAAPEEGVADLAVPGRRRLSKVSRGGSICEECKLVQPKGCSHCEFCQVCIEGFDHHCPWMGKCIGKDNLCAFYTFLTVAFSSLAYIFILALLGGPSTSSTHAHAAKAAHLPWRPSVGEVVTTK